MSGKGDTPRPRSVPREEYERHWDAVFGAKLILVGERDEIRAHDTFTVTRTYYSDMGGLGAMKGEPVALVSHDGETKARGVVADVTGDRVTVDWL